MKTFILSIINHQGFQRYFTNTSWLFAEKLLRIISGLLVGVWVARYLGPQQFGLFSYAVAFSAIFAGVAKLGLDDIVVRELVEHSDKTLVLLGTTFWLKAIAGFFVILLVLGLLPFTNNDSQTNILVSIVSIGIIFQSFEVTEFYFQSQVLAKIISISKVIQLVLSSLIKIFLVLMQADLVWFVWITVFDALTLAISLIFAFSRNIQLRNLMTFDTMLAKSLLRDSWPLIFASLAVMIYMRIDQIMIKELLGGYEVGIYSAAVRLSEAFYIIPTLICSSLFPAIVNAKNHDNTMYLRRLQNLYRLMFLLAVLVALPVFIFADQLIYILYGNKFAVASEVIMVHIWSGIFVFIGVASGQWYIAENLQKLVLVNTAVGAVINIVLNIIFLKAYGVIGAAYATIISYAIASYLMNIVWNATRSNFMMLSKSIFLHKVLS